MHGVSCSYSIAPHGGRLGPRLCVSRSLLKSKLLPGGQPGYPALNQETGSTSSSLAATQLSALGCYTHTAAVVSQQRTPGPALSSRAMYAGEGQQPPCSGGCSTFSTLGSKNTNTLPWQPHREPCMHGAVLYPNRQTGGIFLQ